jgi:hypothetical protein
MPENESTPVSATGGATGRVPIAHTFTEGATRPGSGPPFDPVPPSGVAAPFAPYGLRGRLGGGVRGTECPPALLDVGEPGPENLAYGMTLPSAGATPGVAQEAVATILDVHGTAEKLIESCLVLVHELVAYACLFTGAGEQVQLALCHEGEALRFTVYDTHPPHTHPLLGALCDERRRAALLGVPELVETHRGTWGFCPPHYPGTGTSTWATLTHHPQDRTA